MQHYAAFHLSLQCLQKYPFRGFPNTKGLGNAMIRYGKCSKISNTTLSLLIFCLFDLIFYVPSTIFQLCRDGLPGLNPY